MRSRIHFVEGCPHNSGWLADIRMAYLCGRVSGDFTGMRRLIQGIPNEATKLDRLHVDAYDVLTRLREGEITSEDTCQFLHDIVDQYVQAEGRGSQLAMDLLAEIAGLHAQAGNKIAVGTTLFRYFRTVDRTDYALALWNTGKARANYGLESDPRIAAAEALPFLQAAGRYSAVNPCLQEVTVTNCALMLARLGLYAGARVTMQSVPGLQLDAIEPFWDPNQPILLTEALAWFGWEHCNPDSA